MHPWVKVRGRGRKGAGGGLLVDKVVGRGLIEVWLQVQVQPYCVPTLKELLIIKGTNDEFIFCPEGFYAPPPRFKNIKYVKGSKG